MCFNRQLESFFVAKLSFIPFLKIPKEWYDQQAAKRGLVPKDQRPLTPDPMGREPPSVFTGKTTETTGLIDGQTPTNGSLAKTQTGIIHSANYFSHVGSQNRKLFIIILND